MPTPALDFMTEFRRKNKHGGVLIGYGDLPKSIDNFDNDFR
jgi:hypothetical protein